MEKKTYFICFFFKQISQAFENRGSLSRDFSTVYAVKQDCDDAEVIGGELTAVDDCGVCGGDGTSCRDCANEIGGGKSSSNALCE